MSYFQRTICMPGDLMRAFATHTGLSWSGIEFEGAVCDAMAAAMRPASTPEPVALQDASAHGYQWKQVFLPTGTVLRASFGRQPYYAVVEGVDIKYGEYSLSPSAFANLQGSGNRNAWKAVWLRFPGSPGWVRADECRALQQAATARLFEPDQPAQPDQSEQAQPVAPIGPHQQQYMDQRPSANDVIPMYKMLRDFPDDEVVAAANNETAPGENPPNTSQPLRPAAEPPHPGKQRHPRGGKAGKRQAARRRKHQSS